ncbi:MAG: dipeptide epimerase, partial [Bacteroidales bacterium]|nr:dipeptide epimerase [Bacteroidales bacterium]
MKATKIRKVVIEPLNLDLEEPFRIAIGTKYSIENALVTVILEDGTEGYGEAAPLEPINGENQATALATLKSCVDFIKGKDVTDYRAISATLKGVFHAQVTARCAIEMALIDAYAKVLGIPLYEFFGGAGNRAETDYT